MAHLLQDILVATDKISNLHYKAYANLLYQLEQSTNRAKELEHMVEKLRQNTEQLKQQLQSMKRSPFWRLREIILKLPFSGSLYRRIVNVKNRNLD